MQRELHRLQKIILERERTIEQLKHRNSQIQKQLKLAHNQIETLKAQAHHTFSYQSIPDREIIQTLQAKLASSAWQILQLQKTNVKNEESIIQLQTQLLRQQQELGIKRFHFEQVSIVPDSDEMQDQDSSFAFKQWQQSIKQKELLVQQNLKLKNNLKSLEAQLTEKMAFYFNQVINLSIKIKNQTENQKAKLSEFQSLLKEVKKQNELLRQTLYNKNSQLTIFYQQTKLVSTDKASDMQTIRNLKSIVKKKGQQFYKILLKLDQTQELKKKLIEFNNTCSETMGEFNKLTTKCEQIKRENGRIKQKLKQQSQKLKKYEVCVQDANKKIYELLVENEACHELLYQTKGYSQVFEKDVEAKVQKFLRAIQKRKQNNSSWLDVSELIAVNQKLRMSKHNYEQYM